MKQALIRAGFLPLTDCASLVMASVLGLDEKYGAAGVTACVKAGGNCGSCIPEIRALLAI